MDRYYVVQTKPQRELLASLEIQNQGFQTFLPVVRHLPRFVRGKLQRPKDSPLFPKYVFVQFDTQLDRWRSLNGTRGVVRVMCMNDDQPSAVPLVTMSSLLSTGGVIEEERAGLPFNVNDMVEFTDGSLKGCRGLVKMCSLQRVQLLLNMLGGEVIVSCEPKVLKYIPITA